LIDHGFVGILRPWRVLFSAQLKEETDPMRVWTIPALLLSAIVFAAPMSHAACPTDAEVDAYLEDFTQRRLSRAFSNDISVADAECAKQKLAKKLTHVLGSPIGYKAAFTSAAVQQRFGVDGPRWGYMFDRNIIDIIAVLPHDFGARPLYEADLIVEVKDAGLAEARTPLEALAHLESIVPFIELPDLMLDGQFSGNRFTAVNVGFRGGVTGQEIPVRVTQAFADSLANMTVVLIDEADGNKELGRSQGNAIMGNPLNAAIWLAKSLKQAGISLKKGDLLSLGSLITPAPTQPGMRVRLQYIGLPGDPTVSVVFN
jgi:2-oxo-hept-3-ene-1,7-dioate hydratase